MPRTDFYNTNSGISYPLMEADTYKFKSLANPLAVMSIGVDSLLDAGFIFGPLSEAPADEEIYLSWIGRSATTLTFIFTSTHAQFRFEREAASVFGTTGYVDAYLADGSIGMAYLVTGDLTDLHAALAADTDWVPVGTYRAEPALVQSNYSSQVSTLNLGFVPGTEWEPPEECRSSSSSSAIQEDVIITAEDLAGGRLFSEGYNCELVLRADRNEIQIGGRLGYGLGEICGEIDPNTPSSLVPQLDGIECDQIISTINGVRPNSTGGITIIGGSPGVEVTPYPDEHRITIDFSLRNLDGVFCLEDL